MCKIHDLHANQLAYLTGAGISISAPSLLPSATEFVIKFIDSISENDAHKQRIKDRLFTSHKAKRYDGDFIRFEAVMNGIISCVDDEAQVLSVFSECNNPNHNHFFFAEQIAKGSIVMTTNFDNLIEVACNKLGIKFDLIVTDQDFVNFANSPELYSRPLIKLHGGYNLTLADGAKISGPTNIKTTLPQVGRAYLSGFEENLKKIFGLIFKYRHLCVAGYSGCDDFDVMPIILNSVIENGLTWIDHSSREERPIDVNYGTCAEEKKEYPPYRLLKKYANASPDAVKVIIGDTSSILKNYSDKKSCFNSPSWETVYASWFEKVIYHDSQLHLLMGYLLMFTYSPDETITLLENIEENELTDEKIDIRYNLLGSSYLFINDTEKAILGLSKIALSESRAITDSVKGTAYYNLARLNTDKGEYQIASLFVESAITKYKIVGNVNGLADCAHEKGRIARRMSNFVEAIEFLKISIEMDEKAGELPGVAITYGELANAYADQKKYELATEYFRKSIEISSLVASDYGIGLGYHGLGTIELRIGNYKEAIHYFMQALEFEKLAGSKIDLGHTYHCLGESLVLNGNKSEGIQFLNKSLEIKEQIGDRVGIKNTELSLRLLGLMGIEDNYS